MKSYLIALFLLSAFVLTEFTVSAGETKQWYSNNFHFVSLLAARRLNSLSLALSEIFLAKLKQMILSKASAPNHRIITLTTLQNILYFSFYFFLLLVLYIHFHPLIISCVHTSKGEIPTARPRHCF